MPAIMICLLVSEGRRLRSSSHKNVSLKTPILGIKEIDNLTNNAVA